MELPEEKRPPDSILWNDNPDKLTEWLDKVLEKKGKRKEKDTVEFRISEKDIE